MTAEERAAYDAMVDALYTINEVDRFDDSDVATVNIDYSQVEKALDLVEKAARKGAKRTETN
jgi:hypothetical protein